MDEVVPHLYQYLRHNPGAAEHDLYAHLLIDEYQDLNKAEQESLRYLGAKGAMCVIGDDDQSIYSFRHAHPDGIRQWTTLHPSEEHSIAQCWRCPTTVVAMANALIARNTDRLGTAIAPRPSNGPGDVVVRQYSNAVGEASAVATKIASLISMGVAPGEIIVLAQRQTFATPILHHLRDQGIPVKSYYAETELDTLEAQRQFSLLKLLLNQEDRVALRWLLGFGHTDWRSNPYKRLSDYARANGLSPWATLECLESKLISIPYTGPLIERFKQIKGELVILKAAEDLDKFIELWLPESKDTALLADTVNRCREGVDTIADLYDALNEAITRPEIPLEVAEVRIMSLHKSKGLSSPYVFIVGCVEGLLPSRPDPKLTANERAAKLEEDRRLFYVGITRVKSFLPDRADRPGYLALSYPQKMLTADAMASQISPVKTVGMVAYLQPSRFIAEMAPHAPPAQFNAPL